MGSYTRSMAAATRHNHHNGHHHHHHHIIHNAEPTTSPFLDLLPPELRDIIYTYLLSPTSLCHTLPDEEVTDADSLGGFRRYDFRPFLALQLTSKLVQRESLGVFRTANHFVCISTPWPEAQEHVHREGRVPMICVDDKARAFEGWSMGVLIDAPQLRGPDDDEEEEERSNGDAVVPGFGRPGDCTFVVHVRDVLDFCKMWFYSDLSHPGLNVQLSLTLLTRDPWRKDNGKGDADSMQVDGKTLPRAVQKQFLEPFGRIKGLMSVHVEGDFDPAIYDNMMSAMQVPYETPEHCLEQASKRREEGETALKKHKDYQRAIELYYDAFEHLHIRCEGRRRSIYGDAWFVKTLESGKYEGQEGHLVRLIFRVQLVAGVVHAYLGLGQWETARYWGMRSIILMREANGDEDGEHEDEPMLNFPGAESVGLIYLGTALAYRELKNQDEARRYCKVAMAYLPNDPNVISMQREMGLQSNRGWGWL